MRTSSSRLFLRTLCALVVLFTAELLPSLLLAQTIPFSPKTIRDSKGKDFWLGFPRNHHDAGGGTLDRLYISIVSERPAQGKIEYVQNGQVQIRTFTIPADAVYTFDVPYFGLEMDAPTIGQKSFHITANEEVTVFGLSVASTTSDAFLAFPTDVLGREYVIASYPSNLLFNVNGSLNTNTSTMSQFAIVAAFDSTIVSITPTVRTWNGDTTTYSIVLNQGQTYLVSLLPAVVNTGRDLTGSRIVASKPIVVYGGHERAAIPVGAASRDCLIEQMLPVEVWGKRALVVPYPTPNNGRPDLGRDRVRVIAGYDNTAVTVNGATVATLKAGGFYEMVITTEASVITSEPAIVAGYKCTAVSNLGDPFLAVIPPVEQYLSRYRFVCVQGTQLAANSNTRTEPAFSEHYVTVIVPTTKATTVVLNGRTLDVRLFKTIPTTDYSYASVPLFEGTHSISADTTFGITVAGYGRANSYGYIGGQRFETDIRPPQIVVQRSCTGIAGTAFDSALTDSKIFFFDTLRAAQSNIRFRFGTLPRPADSLTFRADLVNQYEDGALGLVIVDSLDLRSVQRFVVPGFTVHQNPAIRTDAVVSTSNVLRLATGRDYCFRLNVSNYGATNQTIQSIGFTRGSRQFFAPAPRPVRIEPNSQGVIEYCFRSDVDGTFIDTLTISNGCQTRRILAIRIEAAQDRLSPAFARNADSCNRTITLDLADNRLFDSGLDSVQLALTNFTAQRSKLGDAASVPDSTKRPTRITLTVSDPRSDAIYALTAVDSVGNRTVLSDTVRGFTARFLTSADTTSGVLRGLANANSGAPRSEYRFSPVNALSLSCGTILVQNTGIVPFVLESSPFLNRNVQFSLPQSQFPFVVPPGTARPLAICFNPPLVSTYRDTLVVTKFCTTEQIALLGEGLPGDRVAGTRCDGTVRLSAVFGGFNNLAALLQVQHFPDPADELITLRINLAEAQALTVRVYSMMGMLVASLPKQALETGVWDIALNLHNVETGTYYCEVQSDKPEIARWTGLVRVAR